MPKVIKFLFSPALSIDKTFSKDGSGYAVEKEQGDSKRKYLCGISSGPKVDGHGDRMSEECIRDFMEQIKAKDITLYVNHGRDYTRDIGILTHAEITPAGDWYTEYRLYDEQDSVPENDRQESQKVWLQANGLAPYKRARQFGFSIEGMIPDNGYSETETGKIINKVDLDPGVSLVSKPAYTSSIATAIEKSLKANKDAITDVIEQREKTTDYYESKWQIESAFQEASEKIVSSDATPEEKTQSLITLFDSLKEKLIPIMLSRPAETDGDAPAVVKKSLIAVCSGNLNILKNLTKEVENMEDAKTLLMEAISSLQMLLEAMSQNAPAEDIEAKKEAVKKAITKAEEAGKAEPEKMDEETEKALAAIKKLVKKEDPKKEDKPEVEAAKKLLAAKAKLTVKQQEEIEEEIKTAEKILREDAEGLDSVTPEENIDSNNPESNDNALEEVAKGLNLQKSMATLMKNQAEEIRAMKGAMNELLTGFGVVVPKGVSGTGGQDQIFKQLQESIDKLAGKVEKNDLPVNENYVKKNANAFAEFLTRGR